MTTRTATARRDGVLVLLDHGVPLSLLVDLVDPRGPRSEEIYRTEPRDTSPLLAAAR